MRTRKFFKVLLGTLIFSLFTSCTNSLGYSVVLWGDPENNLADGTLVKVYVRSNVSQTYIVSMPDSDENIEIPIWKLSEPKSKNAAMELAQVYGELKGIYAEVKLDGLPIRQEQDNLSKQIYRAKEKEIFKVLKRGNVVDVPNGKDTLQIRWIQVLTSKGTLGWCNENQLELYEGNIEGRRLDEVVEEKEVGTDPILQAAKSKKWYPDYYKAMISSKKIDLNRMADRFSFYFGSDFHKASAVTADVSLSWNYTDIQKNQDGEYEFVGSKMKIILRKNTLTVNYQENGKPKTIKFETLEDDVSEIIAKEVERRQAEIQKIISRGPVFKSSNYGTISFKNEKTVTWTDYEMLPESIITSEAGNIASVELKYLLDDSLKASYQGVLTFRFTGQNKEINFLYELTNAGIRLEDTNGAKIKDNILRSRGTSPLVLYFSN